ncbi:PilN domain-containing protein [Actinoplanes sp. NBC_00393]|uniref:PilN domain-containing protein n=1 Tax=Actinoplanes sp. NBC_00393 TaxID=2975953 RepID=UPI002E1E75D0
MTTALMPLDPTVSPQQASRVLSIRADLLPSEIRDSRRARRTRAFILITLILVLVALGGWYALVTAAKNAADDEYNQTLEQLATVQSQQKKNEDIQQMIDVKQGNTLLSKELGTLLAQDMSWANLLDLIRDTGTDATVDITDISGGLQDSSDGKAVVEGAIGSLTISGTADNKKEVAEYVEALGKLTYLSDPFVNSVTEKDGAVTYSLTVTVTDEGLCGRFTTECKSGGK